MRPSIHQFRLYGPENGLALDQDHESVITLSGRSFRSYIEKFAPNAIFARQYFSNMAFNIRAFLARDLRLHAGMHYLIQNFYRSITEGTPVPIPYREILLTARIMDLIFDQIRAKPLSEPGEPEFQSAAYADSGQA
jgi:hypothetical protein